MVIEEEDFKLIQNECYDRFDLELLYVVNAKDPNKRREEFKNNGNSMTLEYALNKIVNYKLSKNKEVYSLKEYINQFKLERERLEKLVK